MTPNLRRFTCYEYSIDATARLVEVGDCFLDTHAITAIGPDAHGARWVTVQGGARYFVSTEQLRRTVPEVYESPLTAHELSEFNV